MAVSVLKLAGLFSDHLVVQREMPIAVWGEAKAGESVTAEIAGVTSNTTVEKNGTWHLHLPKLPTRGPHVLKFQTSSGESATVQDVLVGEVWLCSGQSNMEWAVEAARDGEQESASAQYPGIRFLTVPTLPSETPVDDLCGAKWEVCSPETARKFFAVGYYSGRALHRELGVPVGLLNASWGGTFAESWISEERIAQILMLAEKWREQEARVAKSRENRPIPLAEVPRGSGPETHNLGYPSGWAALDKPAGSWGVMELPGQWQQHGFDFSGVFWFRREVELSKEWAERELSLSVGVADKDDVTYFNNTPVGSLSMGQRKDGYAVNRKYAVPAGLARTGRNVIAVRVCSAFFDGGLTGPAENMALSCPALPDSPALPLAGKWDFAVESIFGYRSPNALAELFNGMIHPLRNFSFRGAAWYQDESNGQNAPLYHELLPALIADWRVSFRQDKMPFLIVQLPKYRDPQSFEPDSRWALIREAQLEATRLPNVGMTVTLDLGEEGNIHPHNKQDVGRRLASNALASVYGRNEVVPCGPLPEDCQLDGASVRLDFCYAESGLKAAGERLEGFYLAGEDQKFHAADARIKGKTVVLSSPEVPQPREVSYGWADNPLCNLTSAAGLSASPFRIRQVSHNE